MMTRIQFADEQRPEPLMHIPLAQAVEAMASLETAASDRYLAAAIALDPLRLEASRREIVGLVDGLWRTIESVFDRSVLPPVERTQRYGAIGEDRMAARLCVSQCKLPESLIFVRRAIRRLQAIVDRESGGVDA